MTNRYLCQFSCGAASAIATKMTLAAHGDAVEVVNAYIENEHPDNRRFLHDCEKWFGRPITVLRDERYGANIITVFKRSRYMRGPRGAPCTLQLKRKLLLGFERPGDVLVFGFTAEEADRWDDWQERNPERPAIAPLVEAGLCKSDCLAMLERVGIQLPFMYRLGYNNANCIGCVKGGEGYFRAIKEDFPEQFEELAQAQEEIGYDAYLFRNRKTGERYSLRDIPPGLAQRNEVLPSCSFFCELAERDYTA